MARGRSTPPELPAPALKATKARAKELIDSGIEEANTLLGRAEDVHDPESYEEWTHDCERWDARTKAALESAFEGPYPTEFHRSAIGGIVRNVSQTEAETLQYRQEAIRAGINTLRSIAERMAYLEEPGEVLEARPRTPGGKQVFVIHGRDEGLREQVARLLERLGLEAIILQEQAENGRSSRSSRRTLIKWGTPWRS